jgi:23S rRNA (guanosine2251-2'-O)-methyltransferase
LQKRDEDQVVWGRHEVAEALEAGHPVQRVYFSREASGEHIDKIKELAQKRGVRFDFIEVGKLGKLAGTRAHQDVVARLSPVRLASLEDVLAGLEDECTIVALDQVRHLRNVGMIARSAAAAGAAALIFSSRGGHPLNDEVVKASSGAIFHLPVIQTTHIGRDLEKMQQAGFWIYGLAAAGGEDLFQVLVAGNESKGLRPAVQKATDALVRIPMAPEVESLNVAVAMSVALFAARGPGVS